MTKGKDKREPLEQGLFQLMRALDNQVAREMQRTPAERDQHGVQKWEPYSSRIERVAALILDGMGDQEIQLDSLLILAQAMTKALALVASDLEARGLGKMRTAYCIATMEAIREDARRTLDLLRDRHELV